MPENPRTTTTIYVVVIVGRRLLLFIAEFLQMFIQFVLNFILYFISFLEAVIKVLLQMLRIIQEIVKALFTLGSLLYFIGYNLGILGTFLLILGTFTYVCYFEPNAHILRVMSTNTIVVIRMIIVGIWIVAVPFSILCGYAYLKRAISRLKKKISMHGDGQEDNNEAMKSTTIIRYIIDKSTETEHQNDQQTEHQKESPGDRGRSSVAIEKGAEMSENDSSGAEQGRKAPIRRQKERQKRYNTGSDGEDDSPEDQEKEGSRGKGRKRRGRPKI